MKNFLDEKEVIGLRKKHRSERDGKIRDRIKVVLSANYGWEYEEIAEILLLNDETIRRHIKEYLSEKKLRLESGGSESKLNESQTTELKKHLEENTYTKAELICCYVEKTYGIKYTLSGITMWLKNNGFSYKKPKGTPAKADPEKQEEFKKYYNKLKEEVDDEPIVFGDGMHPTMATKITYGWIKTGYDKPIATTASRTRVNILGSINLATMDLLIGSYETINSDAVIDLFKKLRTRYPNASKIHIILDQGPYNKSVATQEAAKSYGIKIHYLPTYSPNLNPIERLWKVMNEHVRNNKFFSIPKEFREAIDSFFNVIWPTISLSMKSRINDNFQSVKSSSNC
jgi:transposase